MIRTYAGVNKQFADRNREIYREWINGAAVRDIAWRWKTSEGNVRDIVRDVGKEAKVEQVQRNPYGS